MPLSPEEIEAAEFPSAMRGYEMQEVRDFLRTVASDYSAVLEAATAPPPPVDVYELLGEEIAGVLRTAEATAAAMERKLVDEAQARSAQVLADAERAGHEAAEGLREQAHEELVEAQRLAAEVVDAARHEAKDIIRDARREAGNLVAGAVARQEQVQAAENDLIEKLRALDEAVRACSEVLGRGS